ncbi:MAG TPA: glycosyltransferase family 39 protein [Chloroflexota bacterium]|nr:glycosyltransferase family 39 protein [Chloroflexota bacterium]
MISSLSQRRDEDRTTKGEIRRSVFVLRPHQLRVAAEVVFVSAGAGWLTATSVTGQRYPGPSLAWLVPFALSFAVVVLIAALMALMATKMGVARPTAVSRAIVTPLSPSWLLVLLLLSSSQANHHFANWPRLRVATLIALGSIAGVALLLQCLVLLQRRYGICSLVVVRIGTSGLVFIGSLMLLIVAGGGHLYTPDEWTIYAAAAGLVNHGVPAAFAGEPYPLHLLVGPIPPAERLPDGTYTYAYSKYGILPTLLTAPLYALARFTSPNTLLPSHAFPYGNLAFPLVPLLFNPIVTAATAALLYQLVVDLGYSRRTAMATAASLAFASLAFPYSKTLMNLPLAALGLLAALWCAVRAVPADGRTRLAWALASGLCTGLSASTRYEVMLLVVPMAVMLPGRSWRSTVAVVAAFAVGLSITLTPLVFGVNLWRSGSLLDFGYRGEGTLSSLAEKPWYGLFGILMSPGCGLIPHSPLMALGLVALIWFWEDAPRPALAAGGIAWLAIMYYGSLNTWCGFTAWGPRYLVTVGPLMALPLAALWHRLHRARSNPFAWLTIGSLALWSVATNLLAVLVDFNRGWQDHWAFGVTYVEVTWLPFFSGITSHLRLLREWLMDGSGGVDLYLAYMLGSSGWILLIAFALTGSAAWAVAWLSAESPEHGVAVDGQSSQ